MHSLREAVYETTDESDRSDIHRNIARAMQSMDSDGRDTGIDLAMHCAKSGQSAQALERYQRAALYARERHAGFAEVAALGGMIAMLDELADSTQRQHLRIETLLDRGLADSVIRGWGSPAVRQAWEQAYELAMATYDEVLASSRNEIKPSFNWFNSTFEIGACFRSAQALWLHGKPEEAHERAERALKLSTDRGEPFHRVITLFHVAMLHEFGRDDEKVIRLANEMFAIASRYDFGFYRSSAKLFIALARLRGSGDESLLADIESFTTAQARRIARHALAKSSQTRNQYWDAGLWTIVGDSLQAEQDTCGRAKRAYENAVGCAQHQGAKMLESVAKKALESVPS